MQNLAWFYPLGHEAHREPGHPERPERIESIKQTMERAGWWAPFMKLPAVIPARPILTEVHSERYLDLLEQVSRRGGRLDLDTYTTTASWELALNAAGGAIALVEAVWRVENESINARKLRGFGLTRPPGHHAEIERGMGFCLLNNAAIAAQHLLTHPMPGIQNARKIAIVDLDLHHGNGTQDIFWRRSDVLYISTHQYPLYPGTGRLEDVGIGAGEGYSVNLPFPPGTGDTGFQVALTDLILPLLERYEPDFILVSAGFDTHWRDPLGHLALSAGGYGSIIAGLTGWADAHARGKIVLITEGGYDLEAMSACALASVAALLGEPFRDSIGAGPKPEGKSWQPVLNKAKEIWQL